MNPIRTLIELENGFAQTPVVKINLLYKKKEYTVYGKLESTGFSGSGKDRIARFILRDAYKTGKIKKGDCIVEATSGNTGIAFSSLGRLLGNRVKIFIPDWMSSERFKILNMLGAEIRKVSDSEGGFLGAIRMTKDFAQSKNHFLPSQFENPLNTQSHLYTTIPELFQRISISDDMPKIFVAGYGTGGMIMATVKFCKFHNIECSVHPLEPASMPLISEGLEKKDPVRHKNHKIEGIVDDFVPSLLKKEELSKPVTVHDNDAIHMAVKINKQGLNIGISGGANVLGCLKQMVESNVNTAATIICDSSLKYLSTDLFNENLELEEGSISPETEIVSIDFA